MSGRSTRTSLGFALVAVLAAAGAAATRTPEPGPTPGPRHHRVEIRGLEFAPSRLDVAPGDTVTWVNRDIVPHTVTAESAGWDSGEVSPGGAYTLAIETSSATRYACRYHPTMIGDLRGPGSRER